MASVMVIISDTHLTDKFDRRKFEYLQGVAAQADLIVIAGDFWDSFVCTFDKFVNSRWKELFPLLRSKRTIYIYGNHDPKERSDGRVALFSVRQCHSLDIQDGELELHIEHGDRIAPGGSILSWLAYIRLGGRPIGERILVTLGKIGFFLFGKAGLALKERKNNEEMKRWRQQNLRENQVLVCGHTHLAELDLGARFANSGFIDYGYASYLKIESSEIVLIEERY